MTDFDDLNAAGLASRGDLFGDQWPEQKRAEPIEPPRLEGQPAFPSPGLYLDMPESDYHAINACSASLLKSMTVSPMLAWATSPLNPEREDDDTFAKALGRAYHARICEGRDAYLERFAVDLEPADFAGQPLLTSTDEIKAAISRFTELAPVKPVGKSKQDFIDQLQELDPSYPVPGTVPEIKAAIATFEREQAVKPIARVPATLDDGTEYLRPATKDDLAEQLLALDPEALIWDKVFAANRRAHEGKAYLAPRDARRIEIAARMIESDPEVAKAFTGGQAEASLFWFDPATGAPCKARVDYLKMNAYVDLKTFGLKSERPVERAIDYEIASRKHYIAVCHYGDGIAEVRDLIRKRGEEVIYGGDKEWVLKWAKSDSAEALFVFQASGPAPITRGRILGKGTVHTVTHSKVRSLREQYVACVQNFGTLPWVDAAPIRHTNDEDVPLFGTDF